MDLSHKRSEFISNLLGFEHSHASQNSAFPEQAVRDFLTSSSGSDHDLVITALSESLRQFENLLSCVSGTFYRCELARPWKMEFISPGVEAITGYAPDFFAEHPYEDIIEPEGLPALDAKVQYAISNKEHFTDCYRIRHKSGELRWVAETGTPVYDADGRPLFLEGFISDVTEKKTLELQAEEARKEIERLHSRLSWIVDNSLEGITTVDADWNYTFANDTAMQETGQDETLVGKNALQVFGQFLEPSAWSELKRAMDRREPIRTECYLSGIGRWYELYAVPDGDGLTSFFRNISERKRLDGKLQAQADNLRTTLDSIPDMVWSAAADGTVSYFNKAWAEYVGVADFNLATDFDGLARNYFHPDDRPIVNRKWLRSIETGKSIELEFRL